MAEMIQGYASLQRRIAAIKGLVLGKDIMQTLGHAAENEIGNLAPDRTGNLRQTIRAPLGGLRDVTASSAMIVASANYALFVEENTRPHEIRPTKAAVLAWATTAAGGRLSGNPTKAALRGSMGLGYGSSTAARMRSKMGAGSGIKMLGATGASSGPVSFSMVVHHPGTTGQHFMRKGAEKAIQSAGLTDRIVAAWNKAG